MITTCLQGGCGNQLFQFAMGYAQAIRFKTDLQLDITRFDNDPMRQYSLGLFRGVTQPLVRHVEPTIYEDGMPMNWWMLWNSNSEDRIPGHLDSNSCLKGYWQTEKYFIHLRTELQMIFKPKQRITFSGARTIDKIMKAGKRSVFLTVRRTDYVNNDFHGMLGMDYYLKALALIENRVEPHVFVFSDEPEWVRENFKIPYEMTVAGNFDRTVQGHLGREDEELYLMSQCRHAVMANSSYSWWGAWLSEHEGQPDRIVIAPNAWFGPASKEDARDIVPDRWIRI